MAELAYDEYAKVAGEAFNKINQITAPILGRIATAQRPPVVAEAEANFIRLRDDVGNGLQLRRKREVLENALTDFFKQSASLVNTVFRESDLDFSDLGKERLLARLSAARRLYAYELKNRSTENVDSLPSPNSQTEKFQRALENASKTLTSLENRINRIDDIISSTYDPITSKFELLDDAYRSGIASINERRKEIDDLAATVGRNAVAGTYAGQATKEETTADTLRALAVIIMIVVIAIAGYSFIEATKSTLNIQNSLLRLAFAVVLSVPAAYLARESQRHRNQQYHYLQTSLELHAISPYVATLPIESQHRLKEQMANKIFASTNVTTGNFDSYPVNIHELSLQLIRAAEKLIEKKDDRESTKDKKPEK